MQTERFGRTRESSACVTVGVGVVEGLAVGQV